MNKILTVENLLDTARKRTGLSDFGPGDFMEGLSILIEGINNEAGINSDRWDHVHERLLRLLVNRMWFARDLADHPQIVDEDVGSPIIIVSLPRTGTTKLQRLMSASGDFQTHALWQEHMFSRIPGEPEGGKAARIQETRDYEKWMYETSPAILTGHPIFTDEADEDIWLLEYTFRHSMLFGIFNSPSYAQWVMQADMTPAYDYLLLQLKYLQWQTKNEGEVQKTWLLKAPNHLGSENQLTRIFNNPRFVFSHRDPLKCIPSVVSTGVAMRKLYSDRDSSAEISAGISGLYVHLLNLHMQWRDNNPDIDILDLSFEEINASGIDAARKTFNHFNIPYTEKAEEGMLRWEKNNPREKHGKSSYSVESLNINEDEIRCAFIDYTDRFSRFL